MAPTSSRGPQGSLFPSSSSHHRATHTPPPIRPCSTTPAHPPTRNSSPSRVTRMASTCSPVRRRVRFEPTSAAFSAHINRPSPRPTHAAGFRRMNGSLFAAYLATVTVLILVPGPDMLFALATGIRSGSRAGFLAAVGAAAGEVVHITTAALGLAALFRTAPLLFDLMRFAGAAYLVYLGIQTLRARNESLLATPGRGAAGARRAFWRGALTNLLNPKMALFTIAFLPQFVDTSRGNVGLQFLVLGACFVALEILVDGTVGMLAGRFRQLLTRRSTARTLRAVCGSVF